MQVNVIKIRDTDPRIAAHIAINGLTSCIMLVGLGIVVTVLAIIAKHYNYIA